ncbi:hypothetical protein [Solimonas marina]|uniref:Lipoprotein n=1 Tax=Solimonas marina TaxID=2714601 RepID=A0A970B918_9GAMM|nr:hypothetical protein [Solimonas marina]NKF22854.1 hypothetical protein [Solimonas marina]
MSVPRGLALLLLTLVIGACQDPRARLPNRANFEAAVADYLAQRGHLCLGLYEWPITVGDADRAHPPGEMRRMVALESLGLVSGQDVPPRRAGGAAAGPITAREYRLTALGRRYYLHAPEVVSTAFRHVTHEADLCAATLSLDRLIGWERPMRLHGRTVTSVLFTYRAMPAPWMQTDTATRAFPTVTRALRNAGRLQVRIGMHLTPSGWVADELSAS